MKDSIEKKKRSKKRSRNKEAAKVSLDTAGVSAGCSWSSVFDAASSLKPADGLDDKDFLNRGSNTQEVNAGLAKISQLAAAANNRKATFDNGDNEEKSSKRPAVDEPQSSDNNDTKSYKRKRSNSIDSEHEEEQESETLEGRMVRHPHDTSQQVMVLVSPVSKLVYSSTERTPSGDLIRLGCINATSNDIVWDDTAFAPPKEDEQQQQDTGAGEPSFPFPVDADDHCESPLQAYQDVLPLLEMLNKPKSDLTIYDPYYCNGSVKLQLKKLGFDSVYNEKEDCYQVWSSGGYPSFDVLLTNPPYSQDHIPKLLEHVTSFNYGNRPWFLLLPMWVHKKDYYKTSVGDKKPFYLVPRKRYTYLPPKQFRTKKKSDTHKKSSPFCSMWYIWGGTLEKTEKMISSYLKHQGRMQEEVSCDLVRSKSALRNLRRKGKRKKM